MIIHKNCIVKESLSVTKVFPLSVILLCGWVKKREEAQGEETKSKSGAANYNDDIPEYRTHLVTHHLFFTKHFQDYKKEMGVQI